MALSGSEDNFVEVVLSIQLYMDQGNGIQDAKL